MPESQPLADTPEARLPLFQASTQFRNWRFSPERLAATRASMNKAAVAVICATFDADEPGSSANVQFLDAAEEHLLVKYYLSKLVEICALFHFPEEVEATAITYLKRFYLKNTVMDWHPKNVMLTALFLATKTTNNPIALDLFTSRLKQSPVDVLDLELLVAQSLSFEFSVWHAHRALWGLWLDLQALPDLPSEEDLELCYDDALAHLRASRYTDAELIYTPSQIALACMSLARPGLADAWAMSKQAQTVLHIAEPIKRMISQDGVPPDKTIVAGIDRRLKLCKNPEKIVGSRAYLAKKARVEAEAEAKRLKKAEDIHKATEEGDPFGEEISGRALEIAHLDDDD
ncbi:cyclin-like protein [Vararia minispora EC-137]|uniref:Cyclin-like protein n=1 Tax=Vararia minispora EC-137 TaxID=1314806 RepID=A0ACB8QR07_9AGAM|nr:cyclin-like protein [Vararia minispora EC-137]